MPDWSRQTSSLLSVLDASSSSSAPTSSLLSVLDVSSSSSAPGTLQIAPAPALDGTSRLDPLAEQRVISIWIMTSDAGGDEVMARKLVQAQMARQPQHWMFDNDCMMHQYQLMVQKQLQLINTFFNKLSGMKYVPLLSKLMHLWRDKAVVVNKTWNDMFGPAAAAFSMKVPPQVIESRWGCVSMCEKYIQHTTEDQMHKVFGRVLAMAAQTKTNAKSKAKAKAAPTKTKTKAKSKAKAKAAAGSRVDEGAANEIMSVAYSEQLSRWRADVLKGLATGQFFLMICIAQKSRTNLDWFLHSCMKKRPPGEPSSLAVMAGVSMSHVKHSVQNADQAVAQ